MSEILVMFILAACFFSCVLSALGVTGGVFGDFANIGADFWNVGKDLAPVFGGIAAGAGDVLKDVTGVTSDITGLVSGRNNKECEEGYKGLYHDLANVFFDQGATKACYSCDPSGSILQTKKYDRSGGAIDGNNACSYPHPCPEGTFHMDSKNFPDHCVTCPSGFTFVPLTESCSRKETGTLLGGAADGYINCGTLDDNVQIKCPDGYEQNILQPLCKDSNGLSPWNKCGRKKYWPGADSSGTGKSSADDGSSPDGKYFWDITKRAYYKCPAGYTRLLNLNPIENADGTLHPKGCHQFDLIKYMGWDYKTATKHPWYVSNPSYKKASTRTRRAPIKTVFSKIAPARRLGSVDEAKEFGKEEVYHVSGDFTAAQANAECYRRYGRLATQDELQEAFKLGANWCNPGHISGGSPSHPVQIADDACGGGNTGVVASPGVTAGATCYGVKPLRSRDNVSDPSNVLPFAGTSWSIYNVTSEEKEEE